MHLWYLVSAIHESLKGQRTLAQVSDSVNQKYLKGWK
jgi:hypothetical protein